jgi:hypothetical protein
MKLTNISIGILKNSFHVIFTDGEGKIIRPKNKQHLEGAMISDFDQQERIELLESAYLNNRYIMLRTVRRIIRLYTHHDKNDRNFFAQDEIEFFKNRLGMMDNIANLLIEENCPIANKLVSEFARFDLDKALEIEADKEIVQKTITNADIIKECEKNKDEILKKMHEVFERRNEKTQPNIIKELIDAGQLKQEPDAKTGKYISFQTPMDFFCWCYENGYEDKINALFVAEHIKTKCSLETLKKYERDARDITDTKREFRRIH